MHDIYLYDDCNVLKNILNIKNQQELDDAEADYVTFRLKEITVKPLLGNYDWAHLLAMHQYIFQDIFEQAGEQRKMNIIKEEPVLGGLSVEYSDFFDIAKDSERTLKEMRSKKWGSMNTHDSALEFSDSLAKLWKIHPFREGNTRTTVTFCCQYADEIGLNPDRKLFEDNAQYVMTALVAYNAVFDDMGDLSKPEYLVRIVEDAILRENEQSIALTSYPVYPMPVLMIATYDEDGKELDSIRSQYENLSDQEKVVNYNSFVKYEETFAITSCYSVR